MLWMVGASVFVHGRDNDRGCNAVDSIFIETCGGLVLWMINVVYILLMVIILNYQVLCRSFIHHFLLFDQTIFCCHHHFLLLLRDSDSVLCSLDHAFLLWVSIFKRLLFMLILP